MDKLASIRNKAFVNELYKIAVKSNHIKDIYNFVKKAAYIDEFKILNNCGSGKTCSFIKSAEEYNITPGYWEGKKGFHKAIAEDPKKYIIDKAKVLGLTVGASVIGQNIGQLSKELQFAKEHRFVGKNFKLKKQIRKAALIPSIVAGLVTNEIAKYKIENDYLKQYGIKKNLMDPRYHFIPEAYQKYYK
jgi:ribosomal protein S8